MATIHEMLEFSGGSFEKAEEVALNFIRSGKKEIILDLQLLYCAQGKYDLAEHWEIEADKYLQMGPERFFNKAWKYMKDGDLQSGMKSLYLSRPKRLFGSPRPPTKTNEWDGSSLTGKKLLLYSEGGLGDEIINARFAKCFKQMGATVILSCSSGLMNLFDSVDGVDTVIDVRAVPLVKHDFWVPAMSAAIFCNTNYGNLPNDPYIKTPVNLAWDYIVKKDKFNVGIRWAGNPKFEHEQLRKFPVEPLFALTDLPGVQLYSFQRDNDVVTLPPEITDLSNLICTWDDTAAAVGKMDLMISSCTSVAHLAGAMGKKTWVLIPIMPYYIWAQPGTTSSWYKTVTLFRQTKFGDWNEPFSNLKNCLSEIVEE